MLRTELRTRWMICVGLLERVNSVCELAVSFSSFRFIQLVVYVLQHRNQMLFLTLHVVIGKNKCYATYLDFVMSSD